jgi:hypothetical protein
MLAAFLFKNKAVAQVETAQAATQLIAFIDAF